jgi:NADH:ubiquinone oxidoreductase subunit E/ferredoxin
MAVNEYNDNEIFKGIMNEKRLSLLELLVDTRKSQHYLDSDIIQNIADQMELEPVEVYGVASFYHFLDPEDQAEVTIYLSLGATPSINGTHLIARALENELGIKFGEITRDGKFALRWTSCIGMNDQEPAMLIDNTVFTQLSPEKIPRIIQDLKDDIPSHQIIEETGDGRNASSLIHSMVKNNIRWRDEVLLTDREVGSAVRSAVMRSREEILQAVIDSGLRGRGGAGFPASLKWKYCLESEGPERYLICNADDIFLDRNRCVMCGRCVEANVKHDGKHELELAGRGIKTSLKANSPDGIGGTSLTRDSHAIQACPVGALTVKQEAYREPVGHRHFDKEPIGSDLEHRHNAGKKGGSENGR